MGQTLSHGVYLPNEGERNCYTGLASNWQILNTAVGGIAEKAPLVHTHGNITNDGKVGTTANVPLITGTGGVVQAGAFGNQANTFCEGNDSRLSDARTPVAHTHGKADVTDLLNSNFIPSANNSYDLGSASKQWLNTYSKGYYYNGVAWGLDKYNQWTGVNDFNNLIGLNGAELWFKNKYIDDFTTNPAGYGSQSVLQLWNKNTTQYSGGLIDCQLTDGSHWLEIACFGYPLNDATPHQHRFRFAAYRDGGADFYPVYNSVVNLGTSTNKWKTLNGIDPGALSLPDMSSGTGVSLSAGSNSYSPPSSGWLSINLTGAISVVCGNFCHSGTDMLSVPVVKGSTYTVTVATSGTAYLFVSQGNV